MSTVACVFVRGHVPFTREYVKNLARMVRRFMDRPYRMVCLTDRPERMPTGVEPIRIPSPGKLKGWWSKIELFSTNHGLTGRVLYLDLDTLIVDDLAPIVDYPAPFALVPDGAPGFQPSNGLATVKRFNSSVMVWNAGELEDLYRAWSPSIAKRLHGDQDFVGEQRPGAAMMPREWFPRLSEIDALPLPTAARVILAKVPKNHIAAKRWPWFAERWRAA